MHLVLRPTPPVFKANQCSGQRRQKLIKSEICNRCCCCCFFFSVKISDKVEELQQPAGMKLCTQKDLACSCSSTPQRRFFFHSKTWNRGVHKKFSLLLLLFFFYFLSPSVQTCSPESFRGHPPPKPTSVDDLRLPGLSGRLEATLSNDRGSGGCLAVQTQAADRVLQSHSFGPPLLQKRQEQPDEARQASCTVDPQPLVIRRQQLISTPGWTEPLSSPRKNDGRSSCSCSGGERRQEGEAAFFLTAHKPFGTWPVGRVWLVKQSLHWFRWKNNTFKATPSRYGIDGCGFIRSPCQNKGLLFTFYYPLIITECQTDCLAKLGQKTYKVRPTVRLETSGLTDLKYFSCSFFFFLMKVKARKSPKLHISEFLIRRRDANNLFVLNRFCFFLLLSS